MSRVAIAGYALAWSPQHKTGLVNLKYQHGQPVRIPVNTADEFIALAVILNESPVFYDDESRTIQTGWEEVGGG